MNQPAQHNYDIQNFSCFLKGTEWEHAELIPMIVDTGLRRYFRLSLAEKTAYLMDMSLSGLESGLEQYIKIDEYLASLGVRVPKVYFYDLETGYAVIEDLGSQSYGDAIRAGDDKAHLYRRATEVLVQIKNNVRANDLDLVEIQKSIPWFKLSFFPLDYIPAATKQPSNPQDEEEFNKIFY